MNWPFNTNSGSVNAKHAKSNVIPRNLQREFDKETTKIQDFEQINKKFYKDVKRYVESLDDAYKSELKMVNNLSNMTTHTTNVNQTQSNLSNTCSSHDATLSSSLNDDFNKRINLWKQLLVKENGTITDNLKEKCQLEIIEPMKQLNDVFPNVHTAIKRRDLALNELLKQQTKLDKYQEKERTGSTLVKIEQLKQQVVQARELFLKENSLLLDELPKFYQSRLTLVYPALKQMLNSQCDFYTSYSNIYDRLLLNETSNASSASTTSTLSSSSSIDSNLLSNQSNDSIDNEIKKCLNDIKSLSIVAGD